MSGFGSLGGAPPLRLVTCEVTVSAVHTQSNQARLVLSNWPNSFSAGSGKLVGFAFPSGKATTVAPHGLLLVGLVRDVGIAGIVVLSNSFQMSSFHVTVTPPLPKHW